MADYKGLTLLLGVSAYYILAFCNGVPVLRGKLDKEWTKSRKRSVAWAGELLEILSELAKLSVTNCNILRLSAIKINFSHKNSVQMFLVKVTTLGGSLPSRNPGIQVPSIFWLCHALGPWSSSFISGKTGKREHGRLHWKYLWTG